jgi:hypothetical protein
MRVQGNVMSPPMVLLVVPVPRVLRPGQRIITTFGNHCNRLQYLFNNRLTRKRYKTVSSVQK